MSEAQTWARLAAAAAILGAAWAECKNALDAHLATSEQATEEEAAK